MKNFDVRRGAPWMAMALFFAIAGCGGDSGTNGGGGNGGSGNGGGGGGTTPVITTSVSVDDFVFTPPNIQVTGGVTVRWTWTGSLSHNVTFTSTSIANSVTQTSGMYAVAMPDATGVYAYRCTIHGFTGSVTVQ